VRVNYQAIGSGAGIQQLEEDLVLFGATDEALKADRLKKIAKRLTELDGYEVELLQVPLTGGSVAICYNVPGLEDAAPLKLPRRVYVDMLLGEITNWSDSRIQKANPGVSLPDLEMTFIRRAESSGTTYIFTSHLNAIDPRWMTEKDRKKKNIKVPEGTKDGPGAGKSVQWPVGIGGKGNSGVNALIKQTPGAFGYIEAGYAELTRLPMAALENKSGKYVLPKAENAKAGLNEAKFTEKNDDVNAAAVTDPKGADAYPIVSFTWVVFRKRYKDAEQGARLKDVLEYCLSVETSAGQALSKDLGYVPLPDEALKRARESVAKIRVD
jgi:phosphate transport system substrate-binding protein